MELSAPQASVADGAAALIAERLRPVLPVQAELLGPAPRFRVRGRERRQLLVKSGDRQAAVEAVRSVIETAASARELGGASLSVDVDPQQM